MYTFFTLRHLSESFLYFSHRFRIEILVSQEKECAEFVLWDKECVQLLNVTAAELKKQLIDVCRQ